MPEYDVYLDADKPESYYSRASCPICYDLKTEIRSFACGQIICQECLDGMRLSTSPRGAQMVEPVDCPTCPIVVSRLRLKQVQFRVAGFTYEAELQRWENNLAAISEEHAQRKATNEALTARIEELTRDLADVTEAHRKLEGIKHALGSK
ncbi:hypothetical protein RSAG8_12582, partial [Rhizoctonia solani AG-8 WAC10335]